MQRSSLHSAFERTPQCTRRRRGAKQVEAPYTALLRCGRGPSSSIHSSTVVKLGDVQRYASSDTVLLLLAQLYFDCQCCFSRCTLQPPTKPERWPCCLLSDEMHQHGNTRQLVSDSARGTCSRVRWRVSRVVSHIPGDLSIWQLPSLSRMLSAADSNRTSTPRSDGGSGGGIRRTPTPSDSRNFQKTMFLVSSC